MPTAARLLAAIGMACLAFVVSGQVIPLYPEGKDFGYFTQVNMGVGALTGWVVMGPRGGRGVVSAINNGLTGTLVMLFWCLAVYGIVDMVELAMRNRYDGPLEAAVSVFQIALDYLLTILTQTIVVTLLVGGIAVGFLTDFAARRWT
jgi:hypothetical protein